MLCFLREQHRPVGRPDCAKRRRAEQNSRRNFTDRQRLVQKAFAEPAKKYAAAMMIIHCVKTSVRWPSMATGFIYGEIRRQADTNLPLVSNSK